MTIEDQEEVRQYMRKYMREEIKQIEGCIAELHREYLRLSFGTAVLWLLFVIVLWVRT